MSSSSTPTSAMTPRAQVPFENRDPINFKNRYRATKRRFYMLLYEQQYIKVELTRSQKRLLKVEKEKRLLLDRLLYLQNLEQTESDSEATDESDSESASPAPKRFSSLYSFFDPPMSPEAKVKVETSPASANPQPSAGTPMVMKKPKSIKSTSTSPTSKPTRSPKIFRLKKKSTPTKILKSIKRTVTFKPGRSLLQPLARLTSTTSLPIQADPAPASFQYPDEPPTLPPTSTEPLLPEVVGEDYLAMDVSFPQSDEDLYTEEISQEGDQSGFQDSDEDLVIDAP